MLWSDAFPSDYATRGWDTFGDESLEWEKELREQEKKALEAEAARIKAEAEKQPDEDWSGEPTKFYHRGNVEMTNPDWTEWRKENPNAPSQFDKPEAEPEEVPEEVDDDEDTPRQDYDFSSPDATDLFFESMFGSPNPTTPGQDLPPEDLTYADAPEPDAKPTQPTQPAQPVQPAQPTQPAQPVQPTPDVKDVVPLTPFQEYLKMEHFDDYLQSIKDPTTIPSIKRDFAVTEEGQIAIGGDERLEAQMVLPEGTRAVRDPSSGNVVTQYDSSLVTPTLLHTGHAIL